MEEEKTRVASLRCWKLGTGNLGEIQGSQVVDAEQRLFFSGIRPAGQHRQGRRGLLQQRLAGGRRGCRTGRPGLARRSRGALLPFSRGCGGRSPTDDAKQPRRKKHSTLHKKRDLGGKEKPAKHPRGRGVVSQLHDD